MKTKYILAALMMSVAGLVACGPDGNNPTNPTQDMQRTVVYSVDNDEQTKTVNTDAEWDDLLDRFCNYAEEGAQVAFYSLGAPAKHSEAAHASKEKQTISTTSREEIKTWMKEMEKQGKTVNVSYDKQTGEWKGVAYANVSVEEQGDAPMAGRWQLIDLNKIVFTESGEGYTIVVYEWNLNGDEAYYTFAADGNATLQQGTAVSEGTWTFGSDGTLCCDLFEEGSCWVVNWCSTETMILTREDWSADEGNLFYQMQLSAANEN